MVWRMDQFSNLAKTSRRRTARSSIGFRYIRNTIKNDPYFRILRSNCRVAHTRK